MQSHHFTCESLLVSGTHNTSLQSFRARSLAQEYLVNYPPCTKPYTNNFLVVLTLGKNSSLLPWRVLSPIVSKGFRNDWQIRICQLSKCLVDFRGRPFDSWGVYGWFQKKKILQTDFDGKKACKEIAGKKNILHWKKKQSSWRIKSWKKIFHRYMSGKKFLTPEAGGKIVTQTNLPISPSPQKSNGQPLRGWLLKCQNCNSGV